MEHKKVLYEDGQYRVPTREDLILNQAIKGFSRAVINKDSFEATKQLGIIEMSCPPDLPYFTGMAYHIGGNYKKAIEYFLQVPDNNHLYSSAMSSLTTAYMATGDYIPLDGILKKRSFEITPLNELQMRLNCLELIDIDDLIASYEMLCNTTSAFVDKYPDNKAEQEADYHICRMFADMLVIAGECINQCRIYKKNVPNSGYDFESYLETSLFAKMYRKCNYAKVRWICLRLTTQSQKARRTTRSGYSYMSAVPA